MDALSPLHLQILLHYYCTTRDQWPCMTGINLEYHKHLWHAGLLSERERTAEDYVPPDATIVMVGIWSCTDKGRAHVQQLCNVPLPRQVWMNDRGEVIV